MAKILIVEDEDSILMALEDDLSLEGYRVTGERNGARALEKAREGGFDLIILDLMLPGLDGLEVCKRLRAEGNSTPILMLTAKSQEIDKVLGLELGADDYVTKPFSPRELQARVKALLRRGRPENPSVERASFGDVDIDFKGYSVTKNGEPVELTVREFELLRLLGEPPRRGSPPGYDPERGLGGRVGRFPSDHRHPCRPPPAEAGGGPGRPQIYRERPRGGLQIRGQSSLTRSQHSPPQSLQSSWEGPRYLWLQRLVEDLPKEWVS